MKIIVNKKESIWMTRGLKISIISESSTGIVDIVMIRHSRTFTSFIAKFYQDLFKKLRNYNIVQGFQSPNDKVKTIWNIVKTETGRKTEK
jgi:hypothetical protein